MILITGDTHGNFDRLSAKKIKDILCEDDYLIIAGDCGLCWADDEEFKYWKKILANKKFTTLFIDGNHENFNMLENYPVDIWHGGKVHHIVKDKVIHLMRGQVYNIKNKKIFTFGGARSHDIQGGVLNRDSETFKEDLKRARNSGLPYRIIDESWWPQEVASVEEMQEGIKNLKANNWQVDYIITHSICTSKLSDLQTMLYSKMVPDSVTDYLEEVRCKTQFKKWFCGHYHLDWRIDNQFEVLYKQIKEVETQYE